MRRSVAMLLLLAALLGGACNLKINMPTLGSIGERGAVSVGSTH